MDKEFFEKWSEVDQFYKNVLEGHRRSNRKSQKELISDAKAFFKECLHLKNFISDKKLKGKVESMFDKERGIYHMKICADIANRDKHRRASESFRLDKNITTDCGDITFFAPVAKGYIGFSKESLKIQKKLDELENLKTAGFSYKMRINFNTLSKRIYLLPIARKCFYEWEEFIRDNS